MMQLYGLVRTKGFCAMVFHDELIPFEEFFNRFKHSSILTTYIRVQWPECPAYWSLDPFGATRLST
ncbi:hypothetical protein K438DRAFT_1962045 [Mycena galopus ATCC 62051]|nr:hypothetical protein K438DRAFT_1962045 [Mycena galopus ATCC 62051]